MRAIADTVERPLRHASDAMVQRLAEQLGETVALYIIDGGAVVVLTEAVSPAELVIRARHEIGARGCWAAARSAPSAPAGS